MVGRRAWASLGALLTVALLVSVIVPVAGAAEQVAPLALVVNGVDLGETLAVIRPGDVLVPVADLLRAGVRLPQGLRETIAGAAHVSLASLAPDVTFDLDERALELRVRTIATLLGTTLVDLSAQRPTGLVYRHDPSAFLNYAGQVVDLERYTAALEAGLSAAGGLLTGGVFRNLDGLWVRTTTSFTYDHRPTLTRLTVGDRAFDLGELGSNLVLGGVSVARDFGLDPYLLRAPSYTLRGSALTPTTADVYVNGVLTRRLELPPGSFELRDLPIRAGPGTVQVVLRDVFGRQQQIISPVYGATSLLAPGLHDFTYAAGFRRERLDTESADYRDLVAIGRHRLGVTERLTLGGRLEGGPELVSGGLEMVNALPLGELQLDAAASEEAGHSGWATAARYAWRGSRFSAGTGLRFTSPRYATSSLGAADDRPEVETSAFLGALLGPRASVTASYVRSELRDQGLHERITGIGQVRLSARTSLVLSTTGFLAEGRSPSSHSRKSPIEVFASLTYILDERTTASVSSQHRGDDRMTDVIVQRSLPVGPGLGYRLQGSTGTFGEHGHALVQYQGPYGRYEVGADATGSHSSLSFGTSGGLVLIGGRLFATPPVQDSYALLRVPGVAGVRGYVENQEVGRTDAQGDLLLPSLRPFIGNRLGIAQEDVPIERAISVTEQVVASPFLGGAVVRFDAPPLRAFTGHIRIQRGERVDVPASGTLTVTVGEARFESPVGRGGEIYLEGLPPGRHPAELEHDGGRCRLEIAVPDTGAPVADLGILLCQDAGEN